uniref:Ion transport domain-containing protein n=1 Tax=Rhizophagus irregularis (strain DAOM 181602 / DAOM 197198 / MUCL 43194) TaxID=747089 RepID=U9TQF0_RHIID
MLHKPQSKYTYNNYLESASDLKLKLFEDLELNDESLKPANDLELASKFYRDAVMLAYLLEYYSENSMTHICWMINVTKYFQNYQNFLIMTIMVYCSSYMDQLFYKPCFGEMRYNFLIRRFKELSVCQGILKVYVPLTSIVPKNSLSYKKVREDILPDIYMVPLPNFTTHNFRVVEKDGKGIFKGIKNFIYLLGYIFLPPEPSPLYYLKASNYTLYNGTVNLTLTGPSQDNPISTIWESILSMYYLSTGNLNNYDYWPLKLLTFIANVILVLVILNMLIALMNDTFNKAKEDGNLGLLIYRAELVNDFEKLDTFSFYNSSYICYLRDPELMKKWMKKSQELSKTKLYSWFNESINKENITYDDDGIDITSWYELISGNEDYQDSSPTPDHMTLWF